MERDWERLGHAFRDARKAIDLTQVEVAKALHVTRTPIQAIERGRQPNGKPFIKVTGTMRGYADLLGWTPESLDLVLAGGAPEELPQAEPAPPAEPASDLPPAVALELRTGKTLDSTVVHIGPEDSDARVIVVLKGNVDITEDEVEALMEEWRRKRRHLQTATPDPDATPDS